MPTKVTDPNTGEEREYFSPEELEEKEEQARQSAIDAFKQEHGDPAETKKQLDDAKKELDDLRTKGGSKDENMTKAIRSLESQIGTLQQQLKDQNTGIAEKINEGSKEDAIAKAAHGDAELEKKIRHHYEKTVSGMAATTKQEILERVAAAYKQSVDVPEPNVLRSVLGTGSGAPPTNTASGKASQEAINMAIAAGVPADKAKEYADQAAAGKVNIVRGDQ